MTQTLEQLSAAATQGEWNTGSDLESNYLYAGRHILAYMSSSQDDGEGGDSFVSGESEAVANAEFCARLVNLYRTGQLVAVQPDDATVERVKDAIGTSLAYDIGMDVRAGSLTDDEKRKLARKAIRAMIDKEATMEGVGG